MAEYRRFDVFTYLGLRHLLGASAATTDRFQRDVITDLVRRHDGATFRRVEELKRSAEGGEPQFRSLHVPSPTMALAEAALLGELARSAQAHGVEQRLYSYVLPRDDCRQGVYVHYYDGYKRRHTAIAEQCAARSNNVVLLVDIKEFYPSVSLACAKDAWTRYAQAVGLEQKWIGLGEWLLDQHGSCDECGTKSILTGPMISHLIGNLVLSSVDDELHERFPGCYFRYVDDIALVVPRDRLECVRERLSEAVERGGFNLHPPERTDKHRVVQAAEWLAGSGDDTARDVASSWMRFAGDLKRFLLVHSEEAAQLCTYFAACDFRMPVTYYQEAARDADWLRQLDQLMRRHRWLWPRTVQLRPQDLLDQAHALRRLVLDGACRLIDRLNSPSTKKYQAEVIHQQLRFLTTKLVMLGTTSDLVEVADGLDGVEPLFVQAAVLTAVGRRDVSGVLPLGRRAASSVARVLALSPEQVAADFPGDKHPSRPAEAVGVLLAHGVRLPQRVIDRYAGAPSVAYAARRRNEPAEDPEYWYELSALQGADATTTHQQLLNSAFDYDEDLHFDPDCLLYYAS